MPLFFKDRLKMREFRISVCIKDMILTISELVKEYGYNAHLKSCGEENIRIEMPDFSVRRWVVERIHSWLNRFRRLIIRWKKKIENYLAMLHLACE
jgi:hypothetical protein